MVKIGLGKHKTDLSLKHIYFELDGKRHFISFKLSYMSGISDAWFDSQKVKIIDAYPPFSKVIRLCASIILNDLCYIFSRLFRHSK